MASAPPAARSAASAAPSPWRVVHQLAELDIDLDRGRMLGLTTLQFRRVHTAAGDAAYAAAPPPLRLHCRVGHVHGVWANGEACPFEMLDSSGQWVGGAHARDLDGFHVLQREALCAAEEGELAITLPQGPLPPVVLGEGAAETSGLSPLLSPTTELHVTIRYELRRPRGTGGAGPVCDGGGVAFVAVDGRDDGTAAAAYGGYGGGYGPQSVGGAGGGAGGGGEGKTDMDITAGKDGHYILEQQRQLQQVQRRQQQQQQQQRQRPHACRYTMWSCTPSAGFGLCDEEAACHGVRAWLPCRDTIEDRCPFDLVLTIDAGRGACACVARLRS